MVSAIYLKPKEQGLCKENDIFKEFFVSRPKNVTTPPPTAADPPPTFSSTAAQLEQGVY